MRTIPIFNTIRLAIFASENNQIIDASGLPSKLGELKFKLLANNGELYQHIQNHTDTIEAILS